MRICTLLTLLFVGSLACSQTPTPSGGDSAAADQTARTNPKQTVTNPFEIAEPKYREAYESSYGGMEEEYGEMGMDDMMSMEAEMGPSRDDLFRTGLQRAIQALKKAKTEQEKQALHGFVREAFSDRYDRMIAKRKKDLDNLKKQIANLEKDLERRQAAKDRVIQLQLQSVQLAAEGLLELNELQGVPRGSYGLGMEAMSAWAKAKMPVYRIGPDTSRLEHRAFTVADADAFYALNSHPDVMRLTGEPPLETLELARQAIADYPDFDSVGYGRWACVLRQSQSVIGFCGLKYLPDLDAVDVGYRFLPPYWGQGLATEACSASLQFGFDTLRLERIIGLVLPENRASIRVLEKVGMLPTGELTYEGQRALRYEISR